MFYIKKMALLSTLLLSFQPLAHSKSTTSWSTDRVLAWCGVITAATILVVYTYRDTIFSWWPKKNNSTTNITEQISQTEQHEEVEKIRKDPADKELEKLIEEFAPVKKPDLKIALNFGKPLASQLDLTLYIIFMLKNLKNSSQELADFINNGYWGEIERTPWQFCFLNCKTNNLHLSPFTFLFYSGYLPAVNLLLSTGLLDTTQNFSDLQTNQKHSFLGNLVKIRGSNDDITSLVLGSHGAKTFNNQEEKISPSITLQPIPTDKSQEKLFFSTSGKKAKAINKAAFVQELKNYLSPKQN